MEAESVGYRTLHLGVLLALRTDGPVVIRILIEASGCALGIKEGHLFEGTWQR